MAEFVPAFQSEVGDAERPRADGFPESTQSVDTLLRRIAGYQGRVYRSDRDAGDPVRVQVSFGQRLVDPGLLGTQRAATLQYQSNPLERRALG